MNKFLCLCGEEFSSLDEFNSHFDLHTKSFQSQLKRRGKIHRFLLYYVRAALHKTTGLFIVQAVFMNHFHYGILETLFSCLGLTLFFI